MKKEESNVMSMSRSFILIVNFVFPTIYTTSSFRLFIYYSNFKVFILQEILTE